MGLDYYAILEINRSSKSADIKKAYRKLALKLHPSKNIDDLMAYEKFLLMSEAFDVLSDASKRAVYDQFGEEGLKSGVPHGKIEAGAWTSGYSYHGSAEKTFVSFFGSENPFQEFYDRMDGDMHLSFGGLNGRSQKVQDPCIERELHLTLEEVFYGCIKKVKTSRRVMNEDGHTSSLRDKILSVTVQRGWPEGTRVTFPKEGDQGPNIIPADIVFILKDRPHLSYRRQGADLLYTAKVSLADALTGCTIDVETLDQRLLHIPITDIIRPGFVKLVPGEGMPKTETKEQTRDQEKGDLVIEFDIEFPKKLTGFQKESIREIFSTL